MLLVRRQARKKLSAAQYREKVSSVMDSSVLEFLVLVLTKKKTMLRLLIKLTKKDDKSEALRKHKESTG